MNRTIILDQNRYEKKLDRKKNNLSIGHAEDDRVVQFTILGKKLIEFVLNKGCEATAEQFYVNRPTNDLKYLLELSSEYIRIKPDEIIFDPGCGAGKHLFYLIDMYNCKGVGVDIYSPAIEIAKIANWNNNAIFYNSSSIEPGFYEKILPDGCDYVFINSWLNHVYEYEGYNDFINKVISSCRYILLVTSKKYDLNLFFNNPVIIVDKVRESARYIVIKGNKS